MKLINGGITAPKGFKAGGVHCGIRKNRQKRDLMMIVSDKCCSAAALYTTNLVKGAPIDVTREHLKSGTAQAVIANSGNANTCNADGIQKAARMCEIASGICGVNPDDVIVASTGVIGQILPIEPIENAQNELKASLGYLPECSSAAAESIMTTDTVKKEFAAEFELSGKTCRIGGIAKGSGMIHPNMATMLCFITTDAAVAAPMLKKALTSVINNTFNMLSIDGDTSTNDTVAVMANGLAGNDEITTENDDYNVFCAALELLCREIVKALAADGEGASRLMVCTARNAKTESDARKCAKGVACSTLFKCAVFGSDANWGRILCAIGYSGAKVDITKIDVVLKSVAGEILVCKNGAGVDFSEDEAKKILLEKEIEVDINLNDGDFTATAWGCDMTYDYVKINGDYRT